MNTIVRDPWVIIVGAGPVGLSAAWHLGAAGIPTLVLERRSTLSIHPKAIVVHSRSMEILGEMGVEPALRRAGLPPETTLGTAWLTRMKGVELGRIMFVEDDQEMARMARSTPQAPCFVAQHAVEPILLESLQQFSCVEVKFSCEVTAISQNDRDVLVTMRDHTGSRTVTTKYLIGADGVRSPTRRMLGIDETATVPYGESVNVYFESRRLTELREGRPYILWWIVNPDVQGAFFPVNSRHQWIFNFEGEPGRPDSWYSSEHCERLIRAAAGESNLDLTIISVLRWTHEQAYANEWRKGRVFLAGDSAHRFPPHGGFGMNSGIQDAANLCWKLVAVLKGAAGEGLLESYEAERKPVAAFNGEQCLRNTQKMQATGWLPQNPEELAVIEQSSGEALRRRIAEAIPNQREQFHSLGQQFGMIYESSAVIPDGRPIVRSTVSEYRMSATPGARCPHFWVRTTSGVRCSTIELMRGAWLLLTGDEGSAWLCAAGQLASELGIATEAFSVGRTGDLIPDGEEQFEVVFGISPAGMVLIRPDGHVGARFEAASGDALRDLRCCFEKILSRTLAGSEQ